MFGQRMEPGLLRILLKDNIPPLFTHSSCRDKHDKRKGVFAQSGRCFPFPFLFVFFPLIRSSRGWRAKTFFSRSPRATSFAKKTSDRPLSIVAKKGSLGVLAFLCLVFLREWEYTVSSPYRRVWIGNKWETTTTVLTGGLTLSRMQDVWPT